MSNAEPMTPAALNLALAEKLQIVPRVESLPIDEIVRVITKSRKGDTPDRDFSLRGQFAWGNDKSAWTFPLNTATIFDNKRLSSQIWEGREGAEYQRDLEAYVLRTAYVPPDYAGDLATAYSLGEEMRQRGLNTEFHNTLAGMIYERNIQMENDELRHRVCHASAYDRALAALRALEGDENG